MNLRTCKTALAVLALSPVLVAPLLVSAAPTIEELWDQINKQQAEIDELKQSQQKTSDELATTEKKVEATADALESGTSYGSGKLSEWAAKTRIGGYGEHHYNNFDNSDDRIDAHRFVLYVAHDYSDTVRFFSEFELEHGVAGEGQPGEVELEQAYIEWDFTQGHSLVLGQFLVPVGIINETHEPDTFYGVERNLVEKDIIPTTWWETGAMLRGELAQGFSYNIAIHSGLKAEDGGKVRGGRQKSAEAIANELAYTARLKYTGVAGLELAASYQIQSDITQGLGIGDNSASLTEFHAAWQAGSFALRALYADWSIDGETFELAGRDSQNGWYIEPSYKFTDRFGAFIRFSSWSNEAGLSTTEENEVIDYGFNFWLNNHVALKLDYQDAGDYNENDSLNLGLGWSF